MEFVKANPEENVFKSAVKFKEADLVIEKGSIRNHKQLVESVRKSKVEGVIVKGKGKKSAEKILVENSDQSQQAIPLWNFKKILEELFGL